MNLKTTNHYTTKQKINSDKNTRPTDQKIKNVQLTIDLGEKLD